MRTTSRLPPPLHYLHYLPLLPVIRCVVDCSVVFNFCLTTSPPPLQQFNGIQLEPFMNLHSPQTQTEVNVLMGINSPANVPAGQPSPFYLNALPSPLGQSPHISTNSAYALLHSFFSPQRTTAPDSVEIIEKEKESTSKYSKPSALRQTASVTAAGGSEKIDIDGKLNSPFSPRHSFDVGVPSTGPRMTNRRFSSGTPLASPNRPLPPSRRGSSNALCFDYTSSAVVKVERLDEEPTDATEVVGALSRCGSAARVTSSVISPDAEPL